MDASEKRERDGAADAGLPHAANAVVGIGTLAAVLLSIHQLFNLQLFGVVLLQGRYLYLLSGSSSASVFWSSGCGPATGRFRSMTGVSRF